MPTTADYPRVGVAVPVADIDAFLATLDTWRADRGPRLVELDERVQLRGSADEREAIALAFVLWKAIGDRLGELHDARDRGRPDDCRAVADAVWTPVTDETGTPLTTDLREAVNGVEDIWKRVDQLITANETASRDLAEQRLSIESDLATADQFAAALGDQVRHVADLRTRLAMIVSPAAGSDPDTTDDGERRRADLADLATAVRLTTEDLRASDATRRSMIDALAASAATLDRLRALEAQARDAAATCRDKIAAPPPRLAVPSVDALGTGPSNVDNRPWPAVRPEVERFLDRLARLDRALHQALDAYRDPVRRRDELRGLVQAYRDKADHKGIAERPDVDAAYQAARAELWSAPCRLDVAEGLVTEYQRLVNESPSAVDSGPGATP